jgi:hypothetical protein
MFVFPFMWFHIERSLVVYMSFVDIPRVCAQLLRESII